MLKKSVYLAILLIVTSIYVNAQEIVTTRPQLKAVVLEEYTGLNCPYCPQGHAAAEAVLNANPGKVSVIAIHEGYYATPSNGQPDFRTEFGDDLSGQTHLEGYPSGTVNRHFFSDLATSGGTALNRTVWDDAALQIMNQESYVNIGLTTEYDDVTRELTVTVEAYYTGNLPFGVSSNFLQIAVTESNIIAYQAGASSSYNHKHMLRYLITDQWGDEIINVAYDSLITRTYVYSLPEEWVASNCDVVAFITESHQEVITGITVPLVDGIGDGEVSGDYARMFTDVPIAVGEDSQNSIFDFVLINGFNEEQDFTLTLTHNAPVDWIVNFEYNSIVYTDFADITLSADEIASVNINVTPGSTPGVAKCNLSLASTDYPNEPEKIAEVFIVSGVDNLIVNGSGSGSEISSYDFESYYKDAIVSAGCQTVGAIPGYAFEQAIDLGALDNITNLYLNIGGTTPVLTLGQVLAIRDYLDNGGNLFLAGQDIARDIMGYGGTSGTITHKTFFQNYLSALYMNDGDNLNNSIMFTTTDSVFGFIPSSSLIDVYNGVFDPDAIKKSTNSFDILHYPNGKAGGLRAYRGTAKIVYLAFGLEQISNADTRNEIIDRTYQWFEGWQGTAIENSDKNMLSISPNPASDFIYINGLNQNCSVNIFDIAGKLIISKTSNDNSVVNISDLSTGVYFVKIVSEDQTFEQKIIVE